MSKSVAKLVPNVPAATRRGAYSTSTKRRLVDVAGELFAQHGYSAASLDAVVTGAKVTKGALYHHFSGKQALFEAVLEQVQEEASKRVRKAIKGERDPWRKATAGLREFLEVAQEERYRRIVVQDGPSVLGYERFREHEERTSLTNVSDIVQAVLTAGEWNLDTDVRHTFARIFFGAMSSAAEDIATSGDPETAAARVEGVVGFLLSGIQLMIESGEELPT